MKKIFIIILLITFACASVTRFSVRKGDLEVQGVVISNEHHKKAVVIAKITFFDEDAIPSKDTYMIKEACEEKWDEYLSDGSANIHMHSFLYGHDKNFSPIREDMYFRLVFYMAEQMCKKLVWVEEPGEWELKAE